MKYGLGGECSFSYLMIQTTGGDDAAGGMANKEEAAEMRTLSSPVQPCELPDSPLRTPYGWATSRFEC